MRIEYEDAVYHVTARGSERKDIYNDDRDRRRFLEILREKLNRHGVRLVCYVIMGNHYHLLIETPAANLSEFMHALQSHYTGYYNRRHNRSGHLFQGRYKALIVDRGAYLIELSRYIHLNPVRAGQAQRPEDWKWSSYNEYVSPRRGEKWIEADTIFSYYGKNRARSRKKYRETVEAAAKEDTGTVMGKVTAQCILGEKDFAEDIRKKAKEKGAKQKKDMAGAGHLLEWRRKEADAALEETARVFGTTTARLKKKKTRYNAARDAAIWLFFKRSRWRCNRIGAEFATVPSGVSKAARRAEDQALRDKEFSKRLALLNSHFTA